MKRFNEVLFGDLYKRDLAGKLSFDNPNKSYMIVPLNKVSSTIKDSLCYEIDYNLLDYTSLPHS